MVDSWEDLYEGALDEELEMLQAMFPDEFKKMGDRHFSLHVTAENKLGKMPCVLECEVPEDYPASSPMSTVNIDIKDHLVQKRLERACEAHLRTFAGNHLGAACLSGLAEALQEALEDPNVLVADDDAVSTTYSFSSTGGTPSSRSRLTTLEERSMMMLAGHEMDEEADDIPPGEVASADAQYESRPGGMRGFSAKTFVFMHSEFGFRTTDGTCVTMSNTKSRNAKWGLLGDGAFTFAELEVGKVRRGHSMELMLGVTASSPDRVDLRWLHQISDTVMVALDCQAPELSLGYQNGELCSFSNNLPKTGSALKPGDRNGVWYTCGELRILQNGRPLLRMRAVLGKRVTLMVLLMGRVVQVQMHVPKTTPTASFSELAVQGSKQMRMDEWLDSSDCAHLHPLM
jgi:hypothetical protein